MDAGSGRMAMALGATLVMVAFAGCANPNDGDGLVLRLGTLLPLTGPLNSIGPDMEAGARLAIKQINAADAGIRIEATYKDDGTVDTTGVPNTFNLLVSQGVTATIGPCCSGVLTAVLDLAKQNEVLVATPSGTNPDMTKKRDNAGYFWRTPPNDIFQGGVMADLVASDGLRFANMIIINNPYGTALADVFKSNFEAKGGKVNRTERYGEQDVNFGTQVDNACAAPTPQAIVLVSYATDGAGILKEMQAKGCLSKVKVYGPEGVQSSGFVSDAGKDANGRWLAAGVKGTAPRVPSDAYKSMFRAEYGRDPQLYSDYTYDTVMYVALAALKADSTRGRDIKDHIRDIANPGGTKTSDFAEAARLIREGQEVDWVGMAHDFEFDQLNEPTKGVFQWWRIDDAGQFVVLEAAKEA